MYIIQLEATKNGARPALQSWTSLTAPHGFALCPDEFFDIFYSTSPAGFVTINVENGIVTSMEVNQEYVDAYVASLPEVEETEEELSQLDKIEAQVTYTAVMTDTLLEG